MSSLSICVLGIIIGSFVVGVVVVLWMEISYRREAYNTYNDNSKTNFEKLEWACNHSDYHNVLHYIPKVVEDNVSNAIKKGAESEKK